MKKRLVLCGDELFLAAHVRTKCHGDVDGAVSIEVVFKESDEHTGGSNNGVVEGVSKVLLAVCAVYADLEAASLCVTEVGAAANFEVFLLTGRPSLNVDGFYLEVCEVTGAAFECTNGNIESTEEVNGVFPELVKPVGAFLGLADNDHFLLFELVDTVNASFLDTVSALLLTEAG